MLQPTSQGPCGAQAVRREPMEPGGKPESEQSGETAVRARPAESRERGAMEHQGSIKSDSWSCARDLILAFVAVDLPWRGKLSKTAAARPQSCTPSSTQLTAPCIAQATAPRGNLPRTTNTHRSRIPGPLKASRLMKRPAFSWREHARGALRRWPRWRRRSRQTRA